MSGRFSDQDALRFTAAELPGDTVAKSQHVGKRNMKRKGPEIRFDPQDHKEYLTGFHKRKVQRKKEAQRRTEVKLKKQLLAERAERKAKLREELQLDKYNSPVEESSDSDEEEEDVAVYQDAVFTTTVTTAPFKLNGDSSDDEGVDGNSGSDGEEGEAGVGPEVKQQQRVKKGERPPKGGKSKPFQKKLGGPSKAVGKPSGQSKGQSGYKKAPKVKKGGKMRGK